MLSVKLPLFIGIVVVLSALLLFVIFRSIVIPIQAALMNLLSIGGALGVTVLVFQKGWFASVLGLEKGPIEPWIPVLMFAVVFGLSMDYEVFLISRVREQWIRRRDASEAVADGIAFTGRVITAAAAIMICVFLSFMLGNERVLKEFGFGLAVAVLLDAAGRPVRAAAGGPRAARGKDLVAAAVARRIVCRTSTSRARARAASCCTRPSPRSPWSASRRRSNPNPLLSSSRGRRALACETCQARRVDQTVADDARPTCAVCQGPGVGADLADLAGLSGARERRARSPVGR